MKKIMAVLLLCFSITTLAQTKSTQQLTLILDWLINPDHAPIFVAEQQGFFKQQGLDVKIIAPTDPSDPPKLVAAGKADIALDYQPHLLLEIAQGLPLVQIGSLIDHPLSSLVVLADGPIKNIQQLKGKRIGYSAGGIDSAIVKTMLEHNGLNLKDVELINVHYDLTKALLAKKIDAAEGLMRNIELIEMDLAHQPGRAFYPEKNGVPMYDELVLVVKQGQENDPKFKSFLKALQMGTDYLLKNPESSWQQFSKNHPELNNEFNHRAWKDSLQYFSRHSAKIDSARCQKLADYLKKNVEANISNTACTTVLMVGAK